MAWQNVLYLIIAVNKLFYIEVIQGNDDCRTLRFNPSSDGKSLENHVIESSSEIETKEDCEHKCYMNADCASYNFGTLSAGEGNLCELSNSSEEIHPRDLKVKSGFSYTPTENFCVDNNCSVNSRCQTGFTDLGFRCLCNEGFTGKFCTKDILLGYIQANPGKSCKHILESGTAVRSGGYWIDPEKDGNPLRVYCDMTTDGGGWLLVTNILGIYENGSVQSWQPASSYEEINKYHNQSMGISADAMGQLRSHLNFTQLRFHCSKIQGHTFHVITAANSSGEAVVQYFSGQTDTRPFACHSFQRMNDDSSMLAVRCDKWGNDRGHHDGKWGHFRKKNTAFRMFDHAAFVAKKFHWHTIESQWLCDDVGSSLFAKSAKDFWKIYVR